MKDYAGIAILLLFLIACHSPESKEINMDYIKDSAHRTIPDRAKQQVRFYDANRQTITADQFNRLLADGNYVSRQSIHKDGSEEVYLVSLLEHSKSLEGTALPDFKLTDIQGRHYTREDLIGKTTILTFWTTASYVCAQELNDLNELAKDYSKKNSIIWLAPTLDPSEDLSRFLRGKQLEFTFISGQEKFADQLGLLTYPTHLIIDEKGYIKRAIVRQSESKKAIKETIGQLL